MIAFLRAFVLTFLLLTPALYNLYLHSQKIDIKKIRNSAVKIMNLKRTGGGTGMIYKSMPDRSWILTNKHVCEVVKQGGWAQTWKGEMKIVAFQKSEKHDLCMVEVLYDLKINNKLAEKAPEAGEKIWVAGHPRLLPLIINEGYTSYREFITVYLGDKACDEKDMQDPAVRPGCLWSGVKPIVKLFDSLLISNLIEPGSSGSPVYNEAGKVVAIVFAGGKQLSKAWCVPWEYVFLFINREFAESAFVGVT